MPDTGRNTYDVAAAAEWLAAQTEPQRSPVPALKERFGLSAVKACEAIAAARQIRQKARNAE